MKKQSTSANSILACCTRPLRSSILSYSIVLFLSGFIMLFAGSCKKDTEPLKNSVPFKAQFLGISTTLTPPTDAIQKDHVTGKGDGTPIGKFDYEGDLTYDLTSPSPLRVTGTATFTDKKGNKIFMTQDSYSPDPDEQGNFVVIGTLTITGGTGKYAHAKGSLTLLVKGNFSNSERPATVEGSISY